jgi:hypothetical protein
VRRVGVGGDQGIVDVARRRPVEGVAVHVERRREEQARRHRLRTAGVHHVARPVHVHGARQLGLLLAAGRDDRGEVDDGVDARRRAPERGRVPDVAERRLRAAGELPRAPPLRRRVVEEAAHGVALPQQLRERVRADVARGAGEQDLHGEASAFVTAGTG